MKVGTFACCSLGGKVENDFARSDEELGVGWEIEGSVMVGKILDDLEVKLTVVNERDDNYDATSGLGLGR